LPSGDNPLQHVNPRVSDLGIGIIEPVYAINTETQRDADRTPNIGKINSFDGSDWLQPQKLRIESSVSGTAGAARLHFDIDVGSRFISGDNPGLWLPAFNETNFSGLVPIPKTSGVASDNDEDGSDSIAVHTVTGSSGKLKDEKTFEFFYEYPTTGPPVLYHARCTNPSADDWYRKIRPWSFELRTIRVQTQDVTILNNVIDPRKGEKVDLHYTLSRGGSVTIQVFNLAGDLVDVLERGRKSSGEYATSWDGRNRAGHIVARGIYYIRVTAPGVDEYRKVLVVK
jgi:hypothetical protein